MLSFESKMLLKLLSYNLLFYI